MRNQTLNQVVDLWNSGKSITEISKQTGIPERDLGKGLLGAVERNMRIRTNITRRK
jgi:hypothetical protein